MNPSKDETLEQGSRRRRPLIVNGNKKRSVSAWLVPLLVILAIMFFLPRVMEMLG